MRLLCLLAASASCFAAEPPVWTPAVIPNCGYGMVADDANAAGTAGLTWASRCNSVTFTSVGGYTVTTNAIQGHSIVQSNGSSQYWTSTYSGTPLTMYAVVRNDGAYSANAGIATATPSGVSILSPYYFKLQRNSDSNLEYYIANSTTTGVDVATSVTPPHGTFMVYGAEASVSGGTISAQINLNRLSGVVTGSGTGTIQGAAASYLLAEYYNAVVTSDCQCSIAEVWAYSRSLSATEIRLLEAYFANKYFNPVALSPYASQGAFVTSLPQMYRAIQSPTSNANTWVDQPLAAQGYTVLIPAAAFGVGQWITAAAGCVGAGSPYGCSGFWPTSDFMDIYSAATDSFNIQNYLQSITCPSHSHTYYNCNPGNVFVDSDGSVNTFFNFEDVGTVDTAHAGYLATTTTVSGTPTWACCTLLTANGTTPWPVNMIDQNVWKIGATYYMLVKNETASYVELWTASVKTGPWTQIRSGDWAGWGSGVEAPFILQNHNSTWRVFLYSSGGGAYYYSDSTTSDPAGSYGALVNAGFPYYSTYGYGLAHGKAMQNSFPRAVVQ